MEELKQELEEKFVEEANIKETGELFRFIEYNSDFIQWLITKVSQVEPEVKPASCEHPRDQRDYIGEGYLRCRICETEFR